MAPPNFPNGMTLHSIGFAALRYPELPPSPPVPLNNQVGVLQHEAPGAQNHEVAQIASQYLNALIEYQTSDDTILNDTSSPQYYFSTAICLLNFLNMNPDVCKRIATHPTLVNSVVEKMLAPEFPNNMKNVQRPMIGPFPPATFDDDFGSILQFLSTLLLYTDEMETRHPRINELIPRCRTWKREYKNSRVKTISRAADRLVDQIQGMDRQMITMMRSMQEQSLVCGVASCRVTGAAMTACGGCRIQRYCSRDHQKADWKYHKHICNKGLEELAPEADE
ncbi:hypothetical protein BDZ45DRAFT_667761 [Acephala macrosclerotiorum]|nr:hypothetical protein BDZ45DRAFT_667761 [Acephala macrosclerotiorum]